MNKNKIAVIACSNACLDYIDHDYDIKIFRSSLRLGETEYLDAIEIKSDDFYKKLEEDSTLVPSSSYMPIGQMIEIYENLVKDGYEKAIVITISKEMSGLYNASIMASRDVEGLEVSVVDSSSVAYPEVLMALKACEMAEDGKDVPEILEELEYIRTHNNIYFAVKTLKYLVKNGRLTAAQGFFGGALKLKPILNIDNDGKINTKAKIRTFKKAIEGVLDLYFEETKGLNVLPFTIHANNYETRDYIVSRLKENDPTLTEVPDVPLSAVVGAHAGPGTIGLGYYIKKDSN